MADSKLADLTEDTGPAVNDWLYKVVNAGTSGSDRKVQVGNVGVWLRTRWALVYLVSAQSIPNVTTTAISFTSEDAGADVPGWHSTSTNPSRMTVDRAGLYAVFARVHFDANATGLREVTLRQNGTTTMCQFSAKGFSEGSNEFSLMPQIVSAAVNDYFEVLAYQASGGALNANFALLSVQQVG